MTLGLDVATPFAGRQPAQPPTAPSVQAPATQTDIAVAQAQRVVDRTCRRCHNDGTLAGDLSLAGFDVAHPERQPAVTEKIIRKLAAGMMPPAGAARPGRGGAGGARRHAGGADRRGGLGQPEPGPADVPAAEPERVWALGARPARPGGRCRGVPATRYPQPRFRQHRRRADPVADVDGGVSAGGQPHQHRSGRRPGRRRERDHRQGAADSVADATRRGGASRHPRRCLGPAQLPGRRRVCLPHDAARRADRSAVRHDRRRR